MTPDATAPLKSSARYFIVLVFLISTFNQADRLLIGIVSQAIKLEFTLSDTLLGLLGGTSFALMYSVIGLPIARLTDRSNRRNMLAFCIGLWSLMTAACGLSASFVQLILARVGVAAGEAGFVPPTHSLMTDFVSERRRAAGFSIIAVGAAVGAFLANSVGGYFTTHFGWRSAFLALGIPGALLALVVAMTLREPPRTASGTSLPNAFAPSLKRLLGNRIYLQCIIASGIHLILVYGMAFWSAPFFIRGFGLTAAKAGAILGVLGSVSGILGAVAGGMLGDRLALRDRRWLALWPALSIAIATPFCLAGFLTPVLGVAIGCLAVAAACNAMYQASTYTLVQAQVTAQERATAAALMILVQSLIGLAIGPLLIGALSDYVTADHIAGGLGVVLACVSLLNIPSALLFVSCARSMRAPS